MLLNCVGVEEYFALGLLTFSTLFPLFFPLFFIFFCLARPDANVSIYLVSLFLFY